MQSYYLVYSVLTLQSPKTSHFKLIYSQRYINKDELCYMILYFQIEICLIKIEAMQIRSYPILTDCLEKSLQFLGKLFQKQIAIASVLGLRESEWCKVTQWVSCIKLYQNSVSPTFQPDDLTTTPKWLLLNKVL